MILGLSLLAGCAQDATRVDEAFFLRREGADMFINVQGNVASERMVLMVHGGPGGSGHDYNLGGWADRLEEEVAVAYWDQRGQGASQGNYPAESVTLTTMAEDTEAVAELLHARYGPGLRLYMLGHSWGGMLGTAALLRTGIQQDLEGWIESDGAHDVPLLNREAAAMLQEVGNAEIEAGRNVEDWTEIVTFAEGLDPEDISIEEGGEINYWGGVAEGLIEDITWEEDLRLGALLAWALRNPNPPITSALSGRVTSGLLLDEVETTSLTDQLGEVTLPTLLLWGRFDFIVPPALGESARDRLGAEDVELVMFETSGHSPMSNEPAAFTQAVLDFIAAH